MPAEFLLCPHNGYTLPNLQTFGGTKDKYYAECIDCAEKDARRAVQTIVGKYAAEKSRLEAIYNEKQRLRAKTNERSPNLPQVSWELNNAFNDKRDFEKKEQEEIENALRHLRQLYPGSMLYR